MINGGATVGDKPAGYHAPVLIAAKGTGVGAEVKESA